MTQIATTLLRSAFFFLVCFAALVMGGFEVPTALRAASVLAAGYFMARSLSRPKARDRTQPRAPRPSLARKVAGGFGAGIAAGAAIASRTDDDSIGGFDGPSVNPANGLPMVGAVDVMGNPYGTDLSAMHDSFSGNADSFSMGGGFNNSSF